MILGFSVVARLFDCLVSCLLIMIPCFLLVSRKRKKSYNINFPSISLLMLDAPPGGLGLFLTANLSGKFENC